MRKRLRGLQRIGETNPWKCALRDLETHLFLQNAAGQQFRDAAHFSSDDGVVVSLLERSPPGGPLAILLIFFPQNVHAVQKNQNEFERKLENENVQNTVFQYLFLTALGVPTVSAALAFQHASWVAPLARHVSR